MFVAGILPEASSANTHERTKKPLNLKINSSPGLSFEAWQEELLDDPDKDFILDGIKHGLNIIDEEIEISPVSGDNGIENGNYFFCDTPPPNNQPHGGHPQA